MKFPCYKINYEVYSQAEEGKDNFRKARTHPFHETGTSCIPFSLVQVVLLLTCKTFLIRKIVIRAKNNHPESTERTTWILQRIIWISWKYLCNAQYISIQLNMEILTAIEIYFQLFWLIWRRISSSFVEFLEWQNNIIKLPLPNLS